MFRIIILVGCLAASATVKADDKIFVHAKDLPTNTMSQLGALKALITTDNKAQVYRCQLVEASNKGTIKNK